MAAPTSKSEAFVYCWTDHKRDMLYVGVHKGTQCDGYISSSKVFNTEYNKRPMDFSRQIIATGDFKSMAVFESKILIGVNAALNEVFYNQNNNNGKFHCFGHTDHTKQKMSNTWKNKTTWNCNNKVAIEKWRGCKHTDESKQKMKAAQKKYSKQRSDLMIINNPMKKPEVIAKMLATRKLNREKKHGGS